MLHLCPDGRFFLCDSGMVQQLVLWLRRHTHHICYHKNFSSCLQIPLFCFSGALWHSVWKILQKFHCKILAPVLAALCSDLLLRVICVSGRRQELHSYRFQASLGTQSSRWCVVGSAAWWGGAARWVIPRDQKQDDVSDELSKEHLIVLLL